MPKILRKFNRASDDKRYYKYLIPISNPTMQKLGWNEKTEIKLEIKGDKVLIKKISQTDSSYMV